MKLKKQNKINNNRKFQYYINFLKNQNQNNKRNQIKPYKKHQTDKRSDPKP